MMILSNYVKIFDYPLRPETKILFSTKKGSIVLIKEKTLKDFEKGELSLPARQNLLKMEMIVPDREKERQEVLGSIDAINKRNKSLNITIVLNLDCNFACPYCFENGIKKNRYLDDEMENLFVEFIRKKFSNGKSHLNIDFFGGEPLLSVDRITSISEKMNHMTSEKDATYSFTVTTNGSLMNRKVSEKLSELGLSTVKVTIDGPPEVHNVNRPFKNGAPSFDLIIKNIQASCDVINIQIGGNYDKTNYKKFVLLFEHLEKRGLTPDRIMSLKFDPVIIQKNGSTLNECAKGCLSVNEPWIATANKLLRQEILIRGFHTPKPVPGQCIIEINDSYVIDTDGFVYKCPAFIGNKEYAIGNIKDNVRNDTATYKIGLWKNEACHECEYLPLCFGGCRYMAFLRDGHIENIDCKKSFYDASLETMIVQDVMYRKNL